MVQVIRCHQELGTIHCHPIDNELQPKINRYSGFLMEGPTHERVSSTSIWICLKIQGPPPENRMDNHHLVGGLEHFGTFLIFPYLDKNNPD